MVPIDLSQCQTPHCYPVLLHTPYPFTPFMPLRYLFPACAFSLFRFCPIVPHYTCYPHLTLQLPHYLTFPAPLPFTFNRPHSHVYSYGCCRYERAVHALPSPHTHTHAVTFAPPHAALPTLTFTRFAVTATPVFCWVTAVATHTWRDLPQDTLPAAVLTRLTFCHGSARFALACHAPFTCRTCGSRTILATLRTLQQFTYTTPLVRCFAYRLLACATFPVLDTLHC